MIDLNIRGDLKQLERAFAGVAEKQLRFGASQAINSLAKTIQTLERENMEKVLDRPTPFTLSGVSVKLSTKASLTATVYVKDKTASYLAPYEVGGFNKLNSKALLKPVDQKVNQYGNLPRTAVKRLAAKKNVFVGKVKTKNGVVDGVWQRSKATRGKQAGLTLLVKFDNAHVVKQHLDYRGLAKRTVSSQFKVEFARAMQRAIASAR
ncbi:hypothetical protein [Paraburkholderia atlantica]|uniref:hypothetical protein n=1 Tax=Paraburkholderia atlantica TaxID=2654982 RepID=UPI0016138971|nr:hypothetical protein [Paraburkholderia atlantica]MBB5414094.1 hypothetical protein [Paraburkholderia atlantica]